MASPILHIKDAYYFEVPKALWRHHYSSLDEVPKFLREGHPEIHDPQEFENALHGKILIPQPFGTPKNLYEPATGFCISKFMILTVVVGIVVTALFIRIAGRIRTGALPRGKLWNLIESMLLFVRDDVVRPAIGKHDADKFLPLLWTMFFFVLTCNLFGMVPWAGAPTAAFSVTLSLAVITLITGLVSGMLKFGPLGFWRNQVPHMDLPLLLSPLKLVIFVIEVASMFLKHGILGVRLLANMVAGHVVLLGIMTMAFSLEGAKSDTWWISAIISVVGAMLFSLLELFVALLQAYVFTFLSSLFIGAAIHHH